ncbi:hypothetical protein EDB80DRAFT_690236 [Ilyonectria destructans]|nr:hypothetical protein EDB80DRAFT_690236 [Ilyonectria destructans]
MLNDVNDVNDVNQVNHVNHFNQVNHVNHFNQVNHVNHVGFDSLNAADPETREEKFMDIYFGIVLHRIHKAAKMENNYRVPEIWTTLVFRMLCWLLLHDFHENDVQIPKSELFSNQLPVYIA